MSLVAHRFLREGRALSPELEEARQRIEALARGYGLDFFETIFELCTYEEINMIASFGGFPTRYPHWRFGMEHLELQKSYEYGLSKIYEMVINTDPSYAYLMDCNLLVDQKLVMAHVFAHVDFFKNNAWFAHTDRKMLDRMANHATRVRRWMDRYGETEVESFIDVCLSLDNLVDPYADHIARRRPADQPFVAAEEDSDEVPRIPTREYMQRHVNPPEWLAEQRQRRDDEARRARGFPESPVRDVLGFVLDHAPLTRWQHDILEIVRAEAMYFAPQGMTKIMNEGWATYWHTRMLTADVLGPDEVIDYADHHSGTVAMRPGQLNPYKMGLELFRHIERRWDRGQFGRDWLDCDDPEVRRRWDTGAGLGRSKIFEVRRTHNDITFLDTFLDEDFCRQQGFFTTTFDPRSNEWVVDSREFAEVKQRLLQMVASKGNPRVSVLDANAENRGELLLDHEHEGLDLQLEQANVTLGNLSRLWSRPVHLRTRIEGAPVTLSHDGTAMKRAPRKEDS